ncbi:MAG: hypothetical protein J6J33_03720, partial [Clostridia bacterium]|nr:hypothetical protein [Clostridia bacterium]
TNDTVAARLPYGYKFDTVEWKVYKTDTSTGEIITTSYTIENTTAFAWTHQGDYHCFPNYVPKTYKVSVYLPNNNAVDDITSSAYYSAYTENNYLFNQEISVPVYSLAGYELQGFYISNTASGIPALTEVNITNGLFHDPLDSALIADCYYSSGKLSQDWTNGKTFYFRPSREASETIYLFAVYIAQEFDVYFYGAQDNYVDTVNNAPTYVQEYAYKQTFNQTYPVLEPFELDGYDFAGWFISEYNYTGTFTEPTTDMFLTSLQDNTNRSYEYGYMFSDSALGAGFAQNWELGSANRFRNIAALYCYAVYTPKTYLIHYYDALKNLDTIVNIPGQYRHDCAAMDLEVTFNESKAYASSRILDTHYYDFADNSEVPVEYGYTFLGYYVSNTMPSSLTAITTGDYISETNSYGATIIRHQGATLTGYAGVEALGYTPGSTTVANTYDDSVPNLVQDWTAENEFAYRYLAEELYAFPVYQIKTYTVHYFAPQNNLYETVNNADSAYTEVTGLDSAYTTVDFNAYYTPLSVSMYGYEFLGWKVSTTPITSGLLEEPTYEFLESTFSKNLATAEFGLITDDDGNGDDSIYFQDWRSPYDGNDFIWRYVQDVYAYAVFVSADYTINYYIPNDNGFTAGNETAIYDSIARGYFSQVTSVNIKFNALVNWGTELLYLNETGYIFKGWYITGATFTQTDTSVKWSVGYVTSYASIDSSPVSDSNAGDPAYLQNFGVGSETFYYRFASTINAYAVLENATSNVHYYKSNYNYYDNPNNVDYYTEITAQQTTATFNHSFTPYVLYDDDGNLNPEHALNGYNFLGWYVTDTEITGDDEFPTVPTYGHYRSARNIYTDVNIGGGT